MKTKSDVAFLITLTILSIIVIGFRYNQIPAHLSFDEVAFAKLALSLGGKPYAIYSPQATGHTTLYFYILLVSLKLFGITTSALRLPSALFAVLTVIMFYLLSKKIIEKPEIAAGVTFVFLSMRWFFAFARFSFEATFLLFLEITTLYFFVDYLKNKKSYNLVIAALFAGLAFHSYTPGRLFFLIPVIILFFRKQFRALNIFLAIVFIIISPLLLFFVQNPDTRVSELSILSNTQLSSQQKISTVFENVGKTALMFNIAGDMNGRHNFPGKPVLNPILGVLFIGGFIETLRQVRQDSFHLLFLFYFIIALVPTLLTPSSDNPNMLRTITVIPAVVYFIGVAIMYLLERFKKYKKHVLITILLLLLSSTLYELRTYFVFQSRVSKNAFEIICPLNEVLQYKTEKLADIPKKCRVSKSLF